MGDVSYNTLGYKTRIRYSYDDHKMQPMVFIFLNLADIAVLRRKTKIQCAKDFYNLCTNNLQNPKSGMYNCCIFIYIETIPGNELVNYKTVDSSNCFEGKFLGKNGNKSSLSLRMRIVVKRK